jgi:hypothetical protein
MDYTPFLIPKRVTRQENRCASCGAPSSHEDSSGEVVTGDGTILCGRCFFTLQNMASQAAVIGEQ